MSGNSCRDISNQLSESLPSLWILLQPHMRQKHEQQLRGGRLQHTLELSSSSSICCSSFCSLSFWHEDMDASRHSFTCPSSSWAVILPSVSILSCVVASATCSSRSAICARSSSASALSAAASFCSHQQLLSSVSSQVHHRVGIGRNCEARNMNTALILNAGQHHDW